MISAQASTTLSQDTIRQTLHQGLERAYTNQRVLVLIPDHTRSIPLPMLFRELATVLHDTQQLDFMVALGTHSPLNRDALYQLVGLTSQEYTDNYSHIDLLNHAWNHAGTLTTLAKLEQAQVQHLAGDAWHPSLGGDVEIRINKHILNYDHILILGPVYPHAVVGFSGGAKYLFPGISGPEMINVTHWLGALITVLDTIGIIDTPVRHMIHAAAEYVPTPITLIAPVVVDGGIAGLFIGDHIEAWRAAAELSSQRHIVWVEEPFQRVLSVASPMYDELWTAAKAMYKLEPAIADGGEVIIYAPHLNVVSETHGEYIYQIGYHVLDYYLEQWERFKDIPLGVLAHGTHLRGSGSYRNGSEQTRINVTLATGISKEDCHQLSLGYKDPQSINPEHWKDRQEEGLLYVPKAGETLYRLKA